MSDFHIEEEFLQKVVSQMQSKKDLLKQEQEALKNIKTSNYDAIAEALYNNEVEKVKLLKNENNPYFAKINFLNSAEKDIDEIYLGRTGFKFDDKQIITDWRAPIATLYYDARLGDVSYNAPGGLQHGTLSLKRQLVIEDKMLKSIFDIDVMSSDELLKPYLNENADVKLKSIISTIQEEQNKIIRKPLFTNTIIQGVAGSGKTTIALHKVAYLVYNYSQRAKEEDFLIIGPNNLFLKYISALLPDLDVEAVKQHTLEEFCKSIIQEDFLIKENNYSQLLKIDEEYLKFKTSLQIKNLLDEFLKTYAFSSLPTNGIVYNDIVLITRQELESMLEKIPEKNLSQKLKIMCDYYTDMFKNEGFLDAFCNKAFEKFEFENTKKAFFEKLEFKEFLKKNAKNLIKNRLLLKKISILKLFKEFLLFLKSQNNNFETQFDTSLKFLNKQQVDFEDLPILIYLSSRTKESMPFQNILHTVVDEAQDLGTFAYCALKDCLKNSSFSIFGDLNQSINNTSSISNWEELFDIFNEIDYEKLTKTYRTTIEIMEVANMLCSCANLMPAVPVIRHGKKPELVKYTENDFEKTFLKTLNTQLEKNYSSYAIICKNEKDCIEIGKLLEKENIEFSFIEKNKENTLLKVNILTNNMAKGLEFDIVIISNVSQQNYDFQNTHDIKMLYVAITRAVHEVNMLYKNELTKPLMPLLEINS